MINHDSNVCTALLCSLHNQQPGPHVCVLAWLPARPFTILCADSAGCQHPHQPQERGQPRERRLCAWKICGTGAPQCMHGTLLRPSYSAVRSSGYTPQLKLLLAMSSPHRALSSVDRSAGHTLLAFLSSCIRLTGHAAKLDRTCRPIVRARIHQDHWLSCLFKKPSKTLP
jgi:hypothetical protein